MAELNWTENSRAVFEATLKAAPMPFRKVTEKNLLGSLTKAVGEGGDVHEADVVKVIKDRSPAPFLSQGLKAIEPHLTDPSILES